MRRPLLNVQPKTNTEQILKTATITRPNIELSGAALEKRLRSKRSDAYTEAMTKLDAGGAVCSQQVIQDLIQAIASEFPELQPHQFPIGIISKCYLGAPYEVHTLDVALEIVEHYKVGQALPAGMERGRSIALHPGYAYVEVFSNAICAVTSAGNVSIIKG